jgi:hypothetical protein
VTTQGGYLVLEDIWQYRIYRCVVHWLVSAVRISKQYCHTIALPVIFIPDKYVVVGCSGSLPFPRIPFLLQMGPATHILR